MLVSMMIASSHAVANEAISHSKVALDAKIKLLAEANAPNHRSKKMERVRAAHLAASSTTNKTNEEIRDDAIDELADNAYASYAVLQKKCIACKLAEDAVVSQLELIISLHDFA